MTSSLAYVKMSIVMQWMCGWRRDEPDAGQVAPQGDPGLGLLAVVVYPAVVVSLAAYGSQGEPELSPEHTDRKVRSMRAKFFSTPLICPSGDSTNDAPA